ncbi:MAG: DUF1330 domain-containing protein [Alphaproteobacteria bacterium]|nr:DUF1330 domain-containing protein [Alphaproteobacteria bacterium]
MTAYLFATIDVHDPDRYEKYKTAVPALIAKHGGRYIVRGGARDVVEGKWPPGRIVLLEFPDWGSANAFVDDPAYEPVAAIRHATTTSHIWLVEGVPDGPTADGMHAYVLGEIRMTDPERYKSYAEKVPQVLADAKGTYLARGGQSRSVEGGIDLDRLVIVAFKEMADARGFHGGDAYAPLIEIRQAASDSNIVIVEGL